MRRVVAGLACALLGCGGSSGTKTPSSGPVVDATVGPDGTAVDDGSASSDSGSSGSFMADAPGPGRDYGPDATTSRSCDAGAGVGTNQCGTLPPVCIEGRYAVNYFDGVCTASRLCAWTKYDFDCFEFEGGTCVGVVDAGFFPSSPEAGLFANANGCQVPVDPSLAPPAIGCDMDAGLDAALCPPPHSVCTGARGSGESVTTEMLYYDDGECVGGQCFWQLGLVKCADGCGNGGCVFPSTTPPPPNP
ncbi:MAG: hypothetical protein ACLP1X_25815 [Polyangiaceae bacterium]|jgi:hypothetical protein